MRLGIDLGGSHIGIGIVNNIEGKIEEKVEEDLESCNCINKCDDKYIIGKIDEYINNNLKKYNIEMIGIATPGDPDQERLEINNLVNLGLNKISFKKIYEKYGIPIKIKNDAKAAGVAEFELGSLKKYKDSVYLCLGTGIGSAVFLNNQLLTANRHIGFELGHMIINKDGIECNCGKRGCFETYCSIKRFKDKAKEILNIKQIDSKNLIKEITKVIENKNSMYYKEITKLVDGYINDLIVGLSNVIDIFEPEAIALGGSFVFFKDIIYNNLIYEMNKRKYVFNKDSLPKIVLASLGSDAGIIGAALD